MMTEREALFNQYYLKMPLVAIGLVRDIAELYLIPNLSEDIIPELQLDTNTKQNVQLMSHLWLD